MKQFTHIHAVILLVLVLLVVGSQAMAQQSYDGKLDIAALMAQARQNYDFNKEDAIILSDEQAVHWLPDGRLSALVHRIVFINSPVGINRYADSRVPFDKDHCSFTTLALRTWRDNQWWPTDSSGIVETLPFALEKASDYTNIREMMLLHNGIEVPCIVEMAYRIEDKAPFRKGANGIWLFSRDEPAVQSSFELGLPAGTKLTASQANRAPGPQKRTDAAEGLDIYAWKMGPVENQPRARLADVASEVPYVAWSTWDTWESFGKDLTAGFDSNGTPDSGLVHTSDSLLRPARTASERARSIARFVNERVASIHYPETYWQWTTRPAMRTYASAYGHSLDRAIFAQALFIRAGLRASPMYVSDGVGMIDDSIPSTTRLGHVHLRITGDNLDALYDPLDGSLSLGVEATAGHTVWEPGQSGPPKLAGSGADTAGMINLRLDLSFDKDKNRFTGSGTLVACNGLSPFGKMSGVDDEAKGYLSSVISGLLKGASVTAYNPDRFEQNGVAVGFSVELSKPEPDDQNRISVYLGKVVGGIAEFLPDDVAPYQLMRTSSVRLPFVMSQRIELRIEVSPEEVVYQPQNETIENSVGQFVATSELEDGQLAVVRELKLKKATVAPAEWPQLRRLLLAENHEKYRTVILKTKKAAN